MDESIGEGDISKNPMPLGVGVSAFNMFNASIGQGMDDFTPLQMANYIATIANGGTRYKVHLVDNIKDSNGKLISKTKPIVIDKAELSKTTKDLVMQGMDGVTGAGGGTDGTAAAALGKFPIATGGKTGTAQFNTVILKMTLEWQSIKIRMI